MVRREVTVMGTSREKIMSFSKNSGKLMVVRFRVLFIVHRHLHVLYKRLYLKENLIWRILPVPFTCSSINSVNFMTSKFGSSSV